MDHHPTTTAPRWHTLAGLGLVVLGVHLWLLVGELPEGVQPATPTVNPAQLAQAAPTTNSTPSGAAPTAPTAPAVTVSQVRWITPQAAPTTPAPAPDTIKTQPKPAKPKAAVKEPVSSDLPSNITNTPETVVSSSSGTDAATEPTPEPSLEPSIESLAQSPAQASPTSEAIPAPTPSAPAAPQQPLPPARVPSNTQLNFDVSGTIRGAGYSAQGTLEWTTNSDRYDARMSVRLPLIGSRVQTSSGHVGPAGLLPERFADKARSERAAHFEHAQQRIRFSNNAPEAALQPGAQDRLSIFLQLAARFNASPQPPGQTIELQVSGTGNAEIWRFTVDEEATLTLPAGEIRTRRLVREAQGPRETQVELWLAPALEHLPVRIRLTQSSGDQIDQQLSRLP